MGEMASVALHFQFLSRWERGTAAKRWWRGTRRCAEVRRKALSVTALARRATSPNGGGSLGKG